MDRDEIISKYIAAGMKPEVAEQVADNAMEEVERFLPNLHKCADARRLKRLNDVAVERDYNRAVTDELIEMLDPDGWSFCSMPFLHEHRHGESCEPHVRGLWLCKVKDSDRPVEVYIDMDVALYMALPEADAETNEISIDPIPPGWNNLPPLTNE